VFGLPFQRILVYRFSVDNFLNPQGDVENCWFEKSLALAAGSGTSLREWTD